MCNCFLNKGLYILLFFTIASQTLFAQDRLFRYVGVTTTGTPPVTPDWQDPNNWEYVPDASSLADPLNPDPADWESASNLPPGNGFPLGDDWVEIEHENEDIIFQNMPFFLPTVSGSTNLAIFWVSRLVIKGDASNLGSVSFRLEASDPTRTQFQFLFGTITLEQLRLGTSGPAGTLPASNLSLEVMPSGHFVMGGHNNNTGTWRITRWGTGATTNFSRARIHTGGIISLLGGISTSVPNTFIGTGTGGIVFENGSVCYLGQNISQERLAQHPFGRTNVATTATNTNNGTANPERTHVFRNGSSIFYHDGLSPFGFKGLTAANNVKIVLEPQSTFYYENQKPNTTVLHKPDFWDGRTYGNFVYNSNIAKVVDSVGNCTFGGNFQVVPRLTLVGTFLDYGSFVTLVVNCSTKNSTMVIEGGIIVPNDAVDPTRAYLRIGRNDASFSLTLRFRNFSNPITASGNSTIFCGLNTPIQIFSSTTPETSNSTLRVETFFHIEKISTGLQVQPYSGIEFKGEYQLRGPGDMSVDNNGRIHVGSVHGINNWPSSLGNIACGTAASHRPQIANIQIVYDGTVTQNTGNLIISNALASASAHRSVVIRNPATVNLNSNLIASRLVLESGQFNLNGFTANLIPAENLTLPAQLEVLTTGLLGTAPAQVGRIRFQGNSFVILPSGYGNFNLWDVNIANLNANQGNLNFGDVVGATPVINNSFTIEGTSVVNTNPPVYATNCTLIYNPTTNPYPVGTEWLANNTGIIRGVPHHVVISNGATSTVQLNDVSGPNFRYLHGNLSIRGTSSGGALIGTLNVINSTTLRVGGNLLVGQGTGTGVGTLNVNGTATVQVDGNVVLGLAASNGTINLNGSSLLRVRGNWTRNLGGILGGSRPVELFGNTNSTIQDFITGGQTFHTLTFNKDALANTVNMLSPVRVSTTMNLTQGRVIATPANFIWMDNPSTTAIVHSGTAPLQSYIDGSLRWTTGNITLPTRYTYPVGNWNGVNHEFRPLEVSEITGAGATTTFTGSYERGTVPGGPGYLFGGTARGVLNGRWWRFQGTGAPPFTARLILDWQPLDAFQDIFGLPANPADGTDQIGVMRLRNSNVWQFTGDPGTLSLTLPTADEPEVRPNLGNGRVSTIDDVLTFFTQQPFYTIGWARDELLVLPIRLLSFRALLQNTDALLNWEVADAAEVQSFEVEYSTNGERFTKIATIPKGGTKYSYRHTKLSPGMHYYRLHMISKDGTRAYSAMELVQLGGEKTFIRGLHQNPVQGGRALIKVYSPTAQDAEAIVVDNLGRVLLRTRLAIPAGDNQVPLSVLPLSGGMYRLLLRTRDGVEKTLPFVR